MRILAVLGVFLFHALHPFDTFDWHVKNEQQSEVISLVLAFLFPWGLGFFFLIAGAASCLALRTRSATHFVQERLLRLLVPYVVGWIVLSPLQSYIEDVHMGHWHRSYLTFIPHFFARAWGEFTNMNEGLLPLPIGWSYHLWFLLYLLWFSLLGLPLFLWLLSPRGQTFLERLGKWSDRRGFPLLIGVPIALLHVAVRAASPEEHAWGEFVYYFGFFVTGYVLVAQPRLLAAVRRDIIPALVVGIFGFSLLIGSGVVDWLERWMEQPSYSMRYAWTFLLFSGQAWAWALATLGIGLKKRRFEKPVPSVAASTAMPFFVLHQPVILAVAFAVVRMDVTLSLKVILVMAPSFLMTASLARLATRSRFMRPLLGAKS